MGNAPPALAIGQVVVALNHTHACAAGEHGVVVETHKLAGCTYTTVVFENGRAEAWSPCEVQRHLRPGRIVESLTAYAYRDARRLWSDWMAGRFAEAFPKR